MSLFDKDNEVHEEISGDLRHPELFETGRDLPGAAEQSQRIIWDIN